MVDLNITGKNGEVKAVKLPQTLINPVVCGAVFAGFGAAIGIVAGFLDGVWNDAKAILKK